MTLIRRLRLQGWTNIIGWLGMIAWAIWMTSASKSTLEAAINTNASMAQSNRSAITSLTVWRESVVADIATVKADVRWLCLQRDPNYKPDRNGEQP